MRSLLYIMVASEIPTLGFSKIRSQIKLCMYVKDDNKVTLFSGELRKIQRNQLKYAMNQR